MRTDGSGVIGKEELDSYFLKTLTQCEGLNGWEMASLLPPRCPVSPTCLSRCSSGRTRNKYMSQLKDEETRVHMIHQADDFR